MKYQEEFIHFVSNDTKLGLESSYALNLIGWGNPNAKILIIGKEPAIDIGSESGRLQYKTEIDNNRQDWLNNIEREIGFDNVYNEFSMQ